ncbi:MULTISPECIES: DUF3710 domain-containing protein [unclassified Nocardioides]|uniref:DUF3710 domain-containing protein n=1 Tax=unclassified Nocardioides TaxID=2615069 RepID=UPI00005717A0|nr:MULTISPECIES: DUF3710 domain-containing protein [unclassified Nocardioides]ABL82409.1 conserved hypothetical protein [Nocardioides sp. JS614]
MKFRRKSADAEAASEISAGSEAADLVVPSGPFDIDDLPAEDDVPRVDLGSMLVAPGRDLELRLQVDEDEEEVQAVVLAGPEGALELRAFAAPRGGDLWSEIRPRLAADYAQRGGTATEREGRFGPELVCQVTVRTQDGRTGTQPSRVIGVNGSRWMLRATLMGRPAQDDAAAAPWEEAIEQIVIRRGAQAMPVGAALPLAMPPREQLVERPST